MKLRTVVIATLLHYAVYFREGDNEYPKTFDLGSLLLGTGYHASLEPANGKPGAWLVFERMILLRYQGLPNQGRTTKPDGQWVINPKTKTMPNGWAAMTMKTFLETYRA